MSLFISKKSTGLPYNMVIKDGLLRKTHEEYTEDIATSHFGDVTVRSSIEPLFNLFECDIPDMIPEQFQRSFRECSYSNKDVPWSYVIPKKTYVKLLRKQIDSIQAALCKVQSSTYPAFFYETNKIFEYLRPSHVDKPKCKSYLLEGENHVLKSVLSMAEGNSVPVPCYNRVSTKTGRLVIKAGPQVLTLKKDFRDIFVPSTPGNKLYEVDFVSLEPRVALNIAGVKTPGDVYMNLIDSFDLKVSREAAKIAVLCSLYGAGNHHLNSLLKSEGSDIKAVTLLKKVREHFKIAPLTSKLKDEASSGFITNCFGRPIEVDGQRDSILINNFLQSSAADLALWGFVDFCESLGRIVRPMFVIHDALIFEASPENIGQIAEYVNKGFTGLGTGTFPLKLTEFSNK